MSHTHSYSTSKKLLLSIVLNMLITALQLVGGFMSGSLALLSDALHNFSDVVSLIEKNGFRNGQAPGRLGANGVYVNQCRFLSKEKQNMLVKTSSYDKIFY